MTEPAISDPPADLLFPEGMVECGCYPTAGQAADHSLVILAMTEECWVVASPAGHHLLVNPAAFEPVTIQLALFDRESIGWPPRPFTDPAPVRKHAPLSPLLWVLAVFALFHAQGEWPAFTEATLLDARRVFDHGEWWRPATALGLHADLGHLVANAGGGLLVFSAVVATFGLAPGWLLIAASAVAGNIAAAALHFDENYRSLGASTAIFAGLGLLSGRALRLFLTGNARKTTRWRTVLLPPVSGLVVLGLYGAGGVNVDVLAHATGFVAGLAAGFIAGRVIPHRLSASNRVL
jgi:membrane associated rhomboid family serine protease